MLGPFSCANRTRYSTPPQLLNRRLDSLADGLVQRVRRTLRPTPQRVRLNCLWGCRAARSGGSERTG